MLNKLGLKLTRTESKAISGIHGIKKKPVGKYDNLPITVHGVTVPTNCIVIDTNLYALLVGTAWLSKMLAVIDLKNMCISLSWGKQEATTVVRCWQQDPPETSDQEESTDEDSEDSDDEEEAYLLQEKPEAVALTMGVSLFPDRLLVGNKYYPRAYMDYLKIRERQKRQPKVLNAYYGLGPERRCRCGFYLFTDDEQCVDCMEDDEVAAVLEVIPLEEVDTPAPVERTDLTHPQQCELKQFLKDNEDMFANDLDELGRTNFVQHTINTGNAEPIRHTLKQRPKVENEFIENEVRRMLKYGLIRPSDSPWAARVVLVAKKNGKLRFCLDYRELNSVTRKDAYPLPRIDDIFDSLGKARWFTSLDLASGYWQVEVAPEDQPKTAFISACGTFEFNVMPFGLTNAPRTFQRLMDRVLRNEIGKFVHVYLDDINVFSETFEEHLQHLAIVFQRLRDAGLRLNPEKCEFVRKSLHFLGHMVSEERLGPDPNKVNKVQDYPVPSMADIRVIG